VALQFLAQSRFLKDRKSSTIRKQRGGCIARPNAETPKEAVLIVEPVIEPRGTLIRFQL
jgi:hypothetical protein